jgi:hypothetical protein
VKHTILLFTLVLLVLVGLVACSGDDGGTSGNADMGGSTTDTGGDDVAVDGTISPDVGETVADAVADATEDVDEEIDQDLPGDNVNPTVSITAPLDGQTVGGQVVVEIDADDNVGVTSVAIAVNGEEATSLTATPYSWTWDTAGLMSGEYTLMAEAHDAAGNSASHEITVAITAVCENNDCPPQSVKIITPVADAKV